MTNEEARAIIRKEYLCVDRNCDIERSCGKCDLMMPTKEPILEAYNMAIKALEQEPKTDVLDKIRAEIDAHREELKTMADDDWYAGKLRGHDCDIEIIDKYKADVEPQERSDKGDIGTHYHCDRCGKSINHYGLCEECDKWLEDNYGEGKKKE